MLQPLNQWSRLKDIRDPEHIGIDGDTVRGRLQRLAEDTAKDIKDCANVCDAYSKRKLIGMRATTF